MNARTASSKDFSRSNKHRPFVLSGRPLLPAKLQVVTASEMSGTFIETFDFTVSFGFDYTYAGDAPLSGFAKGDVTLENYELSYGWPSGFDGQNDETVAGFALFG